MQVKSIAEYSIKLPFPIKTFLLSFLSDRLRQDVCGSSKSSRNLEEDC